MYIKKKKKYGQNFLTNSFIPTRIASESGIDSDCGVIEIGPGGGILTTELLKTAKKVVAIEIDNELIPLLEEKFSGSGLKIINQDILKIDLKQLVADQFGDMPVCVCANLPYYITTPILMKLFESLIKFKTITVMVQKEVADRLCAKKGNSEYGAITVVTNYYAAVKRLFIVSPGSFSPPPKVHSAVIRYDLYPQPPVEVTDTVLFFEIIKTAFLQRRKTFLNSLHFSYNKIFTKEEIYGILNEVGLKPTVRGEELDIYQFALITKKIKNYISKSEEEK